jgi:uncharacterized protein
MQKRKSFTSSIAITVGICWFLILSDAEIFAQSKYLCQGQYRTEAGGKAMLDSFAANHHDKASWLIRAAEIRKNIQRGLQLETFPKKCALQAIRRNKKVYRNYTVENVAFESLPGFFVTGNLYLPAKYDGSIPAMVFPHGHWSSPVEYGRFMNDIQRAAAGLATMGAAVFTYDMVGFGESAPCQHENKQALRMQTWNSIRVVDFLMSLGFIDKDRIGVTGASGGGTQSFILAALDERISLSVPVVMVSAHFYGGCVCESGMPIHRAENYQTSNVEIAATIAPKPQLLISDGDDWTRNTPLVELPYMKNIYTYFAAADNIQNAHFGNEMHDYGYTKRVAMYKFVTSHFKLNAAALTDNYGMIDESAVFLQTRKDLEVFSGIKRPAHEVKDCNKVIYLLDHYR